MDIQLVQLKNSDFYKIKKVIGNSLDYYEAIENINQIEIDEEYIKNEVYSFLEEYSEKKNYCEEHRLGILYEGNIIGVTKFITEFKIKEQSMIGLLMIDKNYRKNKVGTETVKLIENILKTKNQSIIKVGVDFKNNIGLNFWRKLDFEKFEEVKFKHQKNESTVHIFIKQLN